MSLSALCEHKLWILDAKLEPQIPYPVSAAGVVVRSLIPIVWHQLGRLKSGSSCCAPPTLQQFISKKWMKKRLIDLLDPIFSKIDQWARQWKILFHRPNYANMVKLLHIFKSLNINTSCLDGWRLANILLPCRLLISAITVHALKDLLTTQV